MKEPLLILHGAIGSAKQLEKIAGELRNDFEVSSLNFSGHGGNEIPRKDFSIELFSGDVIRWMDEKLTEQVNIFGYSMGGYVALNLALNFPAKVKSIFTLATKFAWSKESAEAESGMLDPEKIALKFPAFANELANRHYPADWKEVLIKTSQMMKDLGNGSKLNDDDFRKIHCNVLLSVGERDKMVSIEETKHVSEFIPNAGMLVLPETPHPIEKIDVKLLLSHIRKFMGRN